MRQVHAKRVSHQRDHGFSDPRKFSTGFNGGLTGRNAMGLSNGRWYFRRHFFWDERSNTLEDQVLQPIQNAVYYERLYLPFEAFAASCGE
jgi:cytochrome c peroxidase